MKHIYSQIQKALKNPYWIEQKFTAKGLGFLESLYSTINSQYNIFTGSCYNNSINPSTVSATYQLPINNLIKLGEVVTGYKLYDKMPLDILKEKNRTEVNLNQFCSLTEVVSEVDIEGFLTGTSTQILELLAGMSTKVVSTMNTTLIKKFNTARGNTTKGHANSIPLSQLKEELEHINLPAILVGKNKIKGDWTFFEDEAMNVCNLGNHLADNDMFAYAAGTLFLATSVTPKQDSIRIYVRLGEDLEELPLDVNIQYNESAKQYLVTVYQQYNLIGVSSNHYDYEHPLVGVNYMYRVRPTV